MYAIRSYYGQEAEVDREVLRQQARHLAGSAEDILFRRSKLGLVLGQDEVAALERYMEGQMPKRQSA